MCVTPAVIIMPADKQSILAALAEHLIFLSGAKSFWFTMNTCQEHGFYLANRFGMTHEHYVALLVAADLAKYVNGVLTIKLFQWESFLRGHHFSDSLVEDAIEVVDKRMSLFGTVRRFNAIRIGIKSMHSPLRFEEQDLDSFPPRLTSLGLTQFKFARLTESMILPMVSELFHDNDDDDDDDDDGFISISMTVDCVAEFSITDLVNV